MPIMWLQDTGILKKLYLSQAKPPTPNPLPKYSINEKLTIEQLGIAAMVAVGGYIIAFFAFLGEHFIMYFKRKEA